MSRYQVMFKWKGDLRFGIVEEWSDEAKKAKLAGELLIEDAVLPARYRVKDDSNVVDIEMDMGHYNHQTQQWEGGDEYSQYVHTEEKKAQDVSDALPEGVHVGKMFQVGVGDGYAYYVVTKVMRTNCQVEWRGFSGDRYVDRMFGYGGTFRIKDVSVYTGWNDGMKKLLKKKAQ